MKKALLIAACVSVTAPAFAMGDAPFEEEHVSREYLTEIDGGGFDGSGGETIDVRRVGQPNGSTLDRGPYVQPGTHGRTGIDNFAPIQNQLRSGGGNVHDGVKPKMVVPIKGELGIPRDPDE